MREAQEAIDSTLQMECAQNQEAGDEATHHPARRRPVEEEQRYNEVDDRQHGEPELQAPRKMEPQIA